MSSEPVIEIKNVWKKFRVKRRFHNTLRENIEFFFSNSKKTTKKSNEFWALKDINITVNKGESVGLYGPNGSGKTTIIKLLAKVTYPTKGGIKLKGIVAPLISVGAGFHPELTGKENIYTNGVILGMSIKQIKSRLDKIMEFTELEEKFLDMPVKQYSSGMVIRLGFAVAIHSNANVFLLDEVLAVGDQSFRDKCRTKIHQMIKDSEKTFFIITHNFDQMKNLTDRIYYINKGCIEKEEVVN